MIKEDELLKLLKEYEPALGGYASPGFRAGVYYALREMIPNLIRGVKKYGEENDQGNN